MRRGGRDSNWQAPWRRRNDSTLSSVHFKYWEACRFKRLTAVAACSIAISIVIWNSRPEPSSGLHIPIHDLQSSKSGFVFPLYHYYRQFLNVTDDLEGEMWRGGRAANRRRLQEDSYPMFNIRKTFYIEMKLGVHRQKFKFHVDTGSRHSWVFCKMSGRQPNIAHLGPHGIFEPKRGSSLTCLGEDEDLCKDLQDEIEPCTGKSQYQCLVKLRYADNTLYSGVFVTDSLIVPMQDRSETNVPSLFGCILKKVVSGESHPAKELTDGLIALGNCKWTLVDQWSRRKLFSQNVLGVCLAEALQQKWPGPVGYISLGIDLQEKFDESDSVWSRLAEDSDLLSYCSYAATLRHISFHGESFKIYRSRSTGSISGVPMVFDTGSDFTYLESELYDPLLTMVHSFNILDFLLTRLDSVAVEMLDSYAIGRGYVRVGDNQKRVCWAPPAKARKHSEACAITRQIQWHHVPPNLKQSDWPISESVARKKSSGTRMLMKVISGKSITNSRFSTSYIFL